MSWQIHAWFEAGRPALEIVDAQSGDVQLTWRAAEPTTADQAAELQKLFRDLLLLSCQQDLCNGRLFSVRG